jgi:hypothetical protein
MADWNGAFTPEMVSLARYIAFNLSRYDEEKRAAILKHVQFCLQVADDLAKDAA